MSRRPFFPENGTWAARVNLDPPSLSDNTADTDRLARALGEKWRCPPPGMDPQVWKKLPEAARKDNYSLGCVFYTGQYRPRVVDVFALSDAPAVVGAAVDLGTSRVVVRLMDLLTDRVLAETAFDNPQGIVAPDILGRIHAAAAPGGSDRLQGLVVGGLNDALSRLAEQSGVGPGEIYFLSVAGNTAMTHLLLGLDARWMIREPYIPAANTFGWVRAADLGLRVHPRARLYPFPNVGSYFGGDLIAGIVSCGMDQQEETTLLVDVGTNAEVVLGNRNWLVACAGAAGPALESGATRMGMMAGPGAIDRVSLNSGDLVWHAIGEVPPRGICGSGLIDLAAALFASGRVDMRGKFLPGACGDRLSQRDETAVFELVPASLSATGRPLCITQVDLESLIRSKAAMYAILETIFATVGLGFSEISVFNVAGTFGSFIDPRSAIAIGMIPDLPIERFRSLGNSSLAGATLLLSRPEIHPRIEAVRKRITYLELNVNAEFMNRLSAAKFLPHTDPSRFPSVLAQRKSVA